MTCADVTCVDVKYWLQDADLLEHVLSVGYRHFMFEPCFVQVLADTLQEYADDEDIFLTLKVGL